MPCHIGKFHFVAAFYRIAATKVFCRRFLRFTPLVQLWVHADKLRRCSKKNARYVSAVRAAILQTSAADCSLRPAAPKRQIVWPISFRRNVRMQHRFLLVAVFLSLSIAASAAVNVTVSSPTNNQQVGSPINLAAHATSSYQIVAWHVYLDGSNVYSAGQTNSISANINAASGSHRLVTRAWDSTGAYGDVTENVSVNGGGGGGNGLPTVPSWAIVYNHIEDRGGWRWCHDPGCAGGSGEGAYWMAQHQSSPSRDGSAVEFYNSGAWANALWYNHLGAQQQRAQFSLGLLVPTSTTARRTQPSRWSSTPSSSSTATTT